MLFFFRVFFYFFRDLSLADSELYFCSFDSYVFRGVIFFSYFNVLFSRREFSFLIDFLHNYIYSYLVFVLFVIVGFFLYLCFNGFYFNTGCLDLRGLEFFRSFVPILVLWFQILPSLRMLYFYGTMFVNSILTVKVVGHQWYWSYLLGDCFEEGFDSYCKSLDSLLLGDSRLLEVDSRLVVPFGVNLRFILTSFDVIHSWTLFNMFLKLDAMGGVLNCFNFCFWHVGLYYGSCSEICGSGHSSMPLSLECTANSLFLLANLG